MFYCCCFSYIYFSDFCQTNYLSIYCTDLHPICRDGRSMAVDYCDEVSFFSFLEGRCRSNQFCGQNLPPIHTFVAHKALARAATLEHDKKGEGEQIT